MNRTILHLSLLACLCLLLCLMLWGVTGTKADHAAQEGQNKTAGDACSPPLYKIGNKTLLEYIEKVDRELGQDPDYADRGISIYCHSYASGRGVDSLRYDITYATIDYLPLPPFILCDSINGKPVTVYFLDFMKKYSEFYMSPEQTVEILKTSIPDKEYRYILGRLREQSELQRESDRKWGKKTERGKDPKLDENAMTIFISQSTFKSYTLVFDNCQNLLRFTKNWYE